MHTLEIATASLQGGREEQQDAVGTWSRDQRHLIVVADGVGGHVGGAAASQAAVQAAADYWKSADGRFDNPETDLNNIARSAHDTISQLNPGERRSPASTVVALYLDGNEAHWIHCGDSRLYWLRKGVQLEQTRDHSVVQLLIEQGKLTPEEADDHPDKGRVIKSLGGSSFKGVDYNSGTFETGDAFCLCSDGYWESLPADAMILPPKASSMSLESYVTTQVREAVDRNGAGSDNTTLAVAYAKPSSQPTGTREKSGLKAVLTTLLYTIILLDIILLVYFFLFRK